MLADLYRRIEDAADQASARLEPGLMDRRAMTTSAQIAGLNPCPGARMRLPEPWLLLAIGESD